MSTECHNKRRLDWPSGLGWLDGAALLLQLQGAGSKSAAVGRPDSKSPAFCTPQAARELSPPWDSEPVVAPHSLLPLYPRALLLPPLGFLATLSYVLTPPTGTREKKTLSLLLQVPTPRLPAF